MTMISHTHLDSQDLQPETFYCIDREHVEFDEYDDSQKCAEKCLKSLCLFQGSDSTDSFFNAILYCLVFNFT